MKHIETLTNTLYFTKHVSQLIHELQRERGLSAAYLGEDFLKFSRSLTEQRKLTDGAKNRLLNSFSNNNGPHNEISRSNIKTVLTILQKLPKYRQHIDTRDISFYKELKFFSSAINALSSSIPHLNSSFASISISNSMEALYNLINMKEYAGIERAFLSNVFSQNTITQQQFRDIQKQIILQKIHYNRFLKYSSIENLQSYQKYIPQSLIDKLEHYRNIIIKSPNTQNFNVDGMQWYTFATDRIDRLNNVIQDIMQNILTKSTAVKDNSKYALIISTLVWIFTLIALIILGLILHKLINHEEKNITDLSKQKEHYTVLSHISENIIYINDEDALYNSLCQVLLEISKFNMVWVGVVNNQKGTITPYASNNISLNRLSKIKFRTNPDQNMSLKAPERAYLEKNYIILYNQDINTSPSCRKILGENIQSVGSFPIYQNNHIIAILSIYSEQEETFNLETINLIDKILKGISFSLDKIQAQRIQQQIKEDLRIASYAFDAQEAMVITDIHANIIKVNHAFTEITGYREEEVLGKNPSVLQSSKHEQSFYTQMWTDLKEKGKWKGEIYNRRKNGEIYPELLSITAIKDEENKTTHYIAQFLDISHIKNAQQEAEYKAQHDVLTGIANRSKLLEETHIAFTRGRRSGIQHAFMFLDIDNFKQINDFYGHIIGDTILVEIASRLRSAIRESDIVARLGGDEFSVIALELDKNEHVAVKKAALLAKKIQKIIAEPIVVDSQSFDITFSIGIKLFPDHEKTAQDVIRHADIAMYQAKKSGRNQFAFFDHELDIESKRFIMIEKDIKRAIKEKQFELHYQPKVDINSSRIIGLEALLRWNHPTKGILYPDAFLDVAKDTKLIHEIGYFLIEATCRQLALWKTELTDTHYSISINITPDQFQKHEFAIYLKNMIKKYNVDASLIELELLEDTFIKNMDGAIEKINTLKSLGIKFSIDDFGTGYSSMTYLQKLPIDNIKIDRSFIMDLHSKSNREIVKMIINFARIFNLNVIAEGVENKYALDFLKENSCDMYQGYYFSRPVSAQAVTELLKKY